MSEMEAAMLDLKRAQEEVRRVGIESCRAMFRGGMRITSSDSPERVEWWNTMIAEEIPLVGPIYCPAPSIETGRGPAESA